MTGADGVAVERQRARERMRYVKPKIAGKVLGHHRYWTVQFLELYLERCDETAFDRPADAYLLAQHLPEMARRIRVGEKAGEWDTPLEKMGGIVMALAVKGSCCRASGEVEEAHLCFKRAFDGLGRHKISAVVMSELHRRYAALLLLARSDEADSHIEKCLRYAESVSYRQGIADALVLRGIRQGEQDPAGAIRDFIQSARLADLKSPRGKRTAAASMQNMGSAIAYGSVALRDQETALRLLSGLKEDLKGTPASPRKLKVLWIEGLLLGNLRIERHSKRQLGKARKGLFELSDIPSFLTASIDMVRLLVEFGDDDEAKAIARDTAEKFERANVDSELLSLLRSWIDRTPSPESIETAHARVRAL